MTIPPTDPWTGVTPATCARLESVWAQSSSDRDVTAFHVSWGPDAALLSPEERAAELATWLEAIADGKTRAVHGLGDSNKPELRAAVAIGKFIAGEDP